MKGRHPVKLHIEGMLTGPELPEIQVREILMNKQVPPVYLQNSILQWAPRLDLAMVTFCRQIPQSVGRMEKIFTSKALLEFIAFHNHWVTTLLFCG